MQIFITDQRFAWQKQDKVIIGDTCFRHGGFLGEFFFVSISCLWKSNGNPMEIRWKDHEILTIMGRVMKGLSIWEPKLPRERSIVTSIMHVSVACVHPGESELLLARFFRMQLTAVLWVHCMFDRTSMSIYIYIHIDRSTSIHSMYMQGFGRPLY